MRMSQRQSKKFADRQNVEILAIMPCYCPWVYVPVPSLWEDWEANQLLFVPSHSVMVYYSSLVLHGAMADSGKYLS